jgi:hypothetical protein
LPDEGIINLTISGWLRASICATMPPIEKPRTSTCLIPRVFTRLAATSAHAAKVGGRLQRIPHAVGVEEEDWAGFGEGVEERGVPVVHYAPEVLIKEERDAG